MSFGRLKEAQSKTKWVKIEAGGFKVQRPVGLISHMRNFRCARNIFASSVQKIFIKAGWAHPNSPSIDTLR